MKRVVRDAGLRLVFLSVSSNGSEWVKLLGELDHVQDRSQLSVSSNGSEWVKHSSEGDGDRCLPNFQYPQTDRSG